MVLIDALTRWSQICLLSSCNQTFARLLINLRVYFLYYQFKKICLDNTSEFTSHAFNQYCMSIEFEVEYLVAHVHTQNGLATPLIKRIKLITRPLLMRVNLLMAIWGYTILHVVILICIKLTSYHKHFPL